MIRVALLNLLIGGVVIALLRRFHPSFWKQRWLRRALYAVMVLAPLGAFARALGVGLVSKSFSNPYIGSFGAVLSGGGSVILLSLFISMPFATLLRLIFNRLAPSHAAAAAEPAAAAAEPTASVAEASADEAQAEARVESNLEPSVAPSEPVAQVAPPPPPPTSQPLLGRRRLLEGAVIAVPALSTGTAILGIGGAFVDTAIQPRKLAFRGLAPELAGLKILQITDLHLGAFITRKGVSELIERAREARPDLVLLTGDICDYLPWLEFALKEVETIEAPLGHFAVMGNHEYYRGARATRLDYARSAVRLLDDEHVVLQHAGRRLMLLGVDDPAGSNKRGHAHYAAHADKALDGAPSDVDFSLALCHRPSGFQAIAERGVHLTLSGHTHGAQAGYGGRSVLEPLLPEWQLWGEYKRGASSLYTSSGAGHWATFRLGCPSEAPLIELAALEEPA